MCFFPILTLKLVILRNRPARSLSDKVNYWPRSYCWKAASPRTFRETGNTQLEPVCQIFPFANQIQWKGGTNSCYLNSPVPSVRFHRVTHKANNASFSLSIVNPAGIVQKHFNAWAELIHLVQSCLPHLLLQSLCHLA